MSGSLQSFEQLEALPPATFKKLYQEPCTTLALFRRMLPNLAKSIVMAMLYQDDPVPMSFINAWVKPTSRREKEMALGKLRRLCITSEKNQKLTLDATFKASFREALTGGSRSFGTPCTTEDKHPVTVEYLDNYATAQWEAILHYMVGTESERKPSEGVMRLLVAGGLMEKRSRRAEITQAGFSFLLQDANTQVWTLLLQYLSMAASLRMDHVEILHFFMLLGSLDLGQAYSKAGLTPTQLNMLEDLRDYGIVYQRKSSSDRYYPTRLATTLTSESAALRTVQQGFDAAMSQSGQGFIVVETNYRLYAYTSSPLQISLLAFFARLSQRYPNLVTGKISRQSIRQAIRMGITASQIIDYLTVNAHPQLRKNTPVLPPTVVDQIRLWQIEGERMKATPGSLIRDFSTERDYRETLNYAEELGVLLWRNDQKRWFFVSRHEQIADFIAQRARAQAAKAQGRA
ncbi:transcription factor Tfb2 [Ascobolus immersus RN42]|uniref:RNA polymerase II transcription factor B subunit 2 n=1 Tax=Ascobolus immersus RN42 TaxID=1160509 RepID=A0A3N4HVZ5_ASCIM|nr:transcription factor Tfb2 [Ascobolus immersus RN42]